MAAITTGGSISATTVANISKVVGDGITNNYPLAYFAKQAGAMPVVGGGDTYVEPTSFDDSITGTWYSHLENIAPGGAVAVDKFQYTDTGLATSIVISGQDLRRNAEPGKMVDLWLERTKAAAAKAYNMVYGAFESSQAIVGTTKAIQGVQDFVSVTPSTGTIGLVARTNAVAQNQFIDASAAPYSGVTTANIMKLLNDIRRRSMRAGTGSTLSCIALGSEYFDVFFQTTTTNNQRYMGDGKVAVGFDAIMISGVPVVQVGGLGSTFSSTGRLALGLNFDALKLKIVKGANFEARKAVDLQTNGQDGEAAYVIFQGVTTCNNFITQVAASS